MTTTQTVDKWETDSGLPGDFDAEITDAGFMVDDKWDRVVLDLELRTDDPDIGEQGVYTLPLGVGGTDKWQVIGRGEKVEHTSGRPRKFHQNSKYGVFLKKAAALAGDVLKGRGDPDDASIWKGTKWHFDRETYKSKDDDGKEVERDRLVPTEFLGFAGDAKGKGGKASGGAKAAPAQVDERLLALARQVKEEGGTVDTLIERAFAADLQPDLDTIDAVFADA